MFCLTLPLLLMFCDLSTGSFNLKDSNEYGPYSIEYKDYDICHGPKSVNLTKYTTSLSVDKNGMYRGVVNLTFLDQTIIEEVKMSVFAIKEKRKSLLWNYIVVKPCQHFALAAVFETYVGANNCVVKKGTYYCDMNFSKIMYTYFGNSFFYGQYIFKVLALSKKGNIICLLFSTNIKKKD